MALIAALSVVGAIIFVVLGYVIASFRRAPVADSAPAAPDGQIAHLRTQVDQATGRASQLEASLATAAEENRVLAAELERFRQTAGQGEEVENERRSLLDQLSQERARAERAERSRGDLDEQLRAERQRADLAEAARARAEEQLEDDLDQTIADSRTSPIRSTQKMFPKGSEDSAAFSSLQLDLRKERERAAKVEEAKQAAERRIRELEGELEEARTSLAFVEEQPEDELEGEPTQVVTLADPETIAQAEKEMARLRSEVAKLSADSRNLVKVKGELENRERLLAEARKKLAEVQKELESARRKLGAAKQTSGELTRARSELARTKGQLEKLQKELAETKQQLLKAKAEAESKNKALERARGEIHQAEVDGRTAASHAAEVERLTAERRILREQLEERGSLTTELAGLETELQEARIKAQTAETRGEELERLKEENRVLRDARKRDESVRSELEDARSELREAQIKAQTAESRGEELERLLVENRNMREDLRDLEDLRAESAEFSTLKSAHQNLRLESEVLGRKLEELERMESECLDLRGRVEELGREADEAGRLRARLSSLEAQLFAAGQTPHAAQAADGPEGRADRVLAEHGPIDEILAKMAETSGVRSAVVADLQGLLVGGVGEGGYHEEMAAISGTAEDLSVRATGILPLDRIHSVCLSDVNQLILSCHYFLSGGDTFALTALRRESPLPAETVAETIEKLTTALEG